MSEIPGAMLCLRGFPRMDFYGRLQDVRPRKLAKHIERRNAERAKQRRRRQQAEFMARLREFERLRSELLRGLKA